MWHLAQRLRGCPRSALELPQVTQTGILGSKTSKTSESIETSKLVSQSSESLVDGMILVEVLLDPSDVEKPW